MTSRYWDVNGLMGKTACGITIRSARETTSAAKRWTSVVSRLSTSNSSCGQEDHLRFKLAPFEQDHRVVKSRVGPMLGFQALPQYPARRGQPGVGPGVFRSLLLGKITSPRPPLRDKPPRGIGSPPLLSPRPILRCSGQPQPESKSYFRVELLYDVVEVLL